MKNLLIIFALTNLISVAKATPSVSVPFSTATRDSLPLVFVLGQDDRAFDALKTEHDLQLLTVCRNDMEMTYYLWIQMMKQMESYANRTGFDLNGIKLWMYAFYNKDGSIHHLAYHAKPQSRNFKPEDMTTFLEGFVKTYKLPMTAERSFQHYNVGHFPVLVEKNPTAPAPSSKDQRSGLNGTTPKSGSKAGRD